MKKYRLLSFAILLIGSMLLPHNNLFAQQLELQPIEEIPTNTPTTPYPATPQQPPVTKKAVSFDGPEATIAVQSNIVDFGTLTPTNPVLRFTTLKMLGDFPYSLITYQDNFLRTADQQNFIPNTSCDRGNCNEKTHDTWVSTLTYGVGIQCKATSPTTRCTLPTPTNESFHTLPTYFPESALASATDNAEVKIIYKINTSPSQNPGIYQNTIYYVLTPSL
jgi:hypothetical protein